MSDSAIPWTIATGFLCPWDFPGEDAGVGCHFLLQGIFQTQGSNPCLLHLMHWQVDSLPPAPPGLLFQGCCNKSLQTRDLFPHNMEDRSKIKVSTGPHCLWSLWGGGMGGHFLSLPVSGGSRQPLLRLHPSSLPHCVSVCFLLLLGHQSLDPGPPYSSRSWSSLITSKETPFPHSISF